MKFILLIAHLLCTSNVFGQTENIDKTKIDVYGIWHPSRTGFVSKFAMSVSIKKLRKHVDFTITTNYSKINDYKFWGVTVSNIDLFAGLSFPFYGERFYIEPVIQAGYLKEDRHAFGGYGYSDTGGFAGELRAGILLGNFGIALRARQSITLGQLREFYPPQNSQRSVILIPFEYGIGLRYHF